MEDGKAVGGGGAMRCVYDEVFSDDAAMVATAVGLCFDGVRATVLRNYTGLLSEQDEERLELIKGRGDPQHHLAYFLLAVAHEHALRDAIVRDAAQEMASKLFSFHRLLAIATRSLFETAFTETTAPILVGRFLHICCLAWRCMDDAGIAALCDSFAARTEEEHRRIQTGGGCRVELRGKELLQQVVRVRQPTSNDSK